MFETIYNLIILFLSLAGVTAIIRILYIWFLQRGNIGNQFYVVLLDSDSCENDLRSAIQFSREVGGRYCEKIICVDSGMDHEAKSVFNRFAREHHNLYLCPLDHVESFFKSLQNR